MTKLSNSSVAASLQHDSHSSGHTIRFLVPGDLRYTYCDCAAPAPCNHVPIAIWAFRKLLPHQKSGIISTETQLETTPFELLDDIEAALCELVKTGLKGLSDSLLGRLERLEQRCRKAVLIWPAEILIELIQECDHYRQRDALFSANHVVELIGELCIRMDAIRNATVAVPQLFVRGTQSDRITDLGAARLIGLGCGVQTHKLNIRLTSYFQDADSGAVMAFSRNFTDVPTTQNELPKEFCQLAQAKVLKQTSMEQVAAGQLLLKGGKRSPDFQLIPGRSQIIINPQTFQWENLRAPLLVEDFSELQNHLRHLPPSSLSPRRQTETLKVFSVHSLKSAKFCVVEQAVIAKILDQLGNEAKIYFPYNNRAHLGIETLLSCLAQMNLLFLAGNVHLKSNEIIVVPISLVFSRSNTRFILQPWIYSKKEQDILVGRTFECDNVTSSLLKNSIEKWFVYCLETLSDIILIGSDQIDNRLLNMLESIYDYGIDLGLEYLLNSWKRILALRDKDSLDWQDNQAILESQLLELMLILRISQDF